MVKLLIADRDENERVGIKWLVSSYSIPYEEVFLARTALETIRILEKDMPEVVCVELDMFQSDAWQELQYALNRYARFCIVMTAEATFERALQAIELHAYSFWLKPILPDEIKRVLQHCYKQAEQKQSRYSSQIQPTNTLSYRTLFVEGEAPDYNDYCILLLQTENIKDLPLLRSYIEDYSFQIQPSILPLSDMMACVFARMTGTDSYLIQQGNLLLKQWEERYRIPIAGIYYVPKQNESLHKCYMEAKQSLDIHFFKGYRQLTVLKQPIKWGEIDPFLTPEDQRNWIGMLNEGDLDKIKNWMHAEFLNFSHYYPDPGLLRIRLSSILAQVRRFMKSYHLDQGELEIKYHRVFESILYTSVLYRIVQDFVLFLKEVIDRATLHRQEKILDVTEKAIQFVEQHYMESDLNLEKVAQFVDRNPAYLSSQLSRKNKETFRQLLTQIRIRQAQALLKESDNTIQQIADLTGFSNPNYFSRIFKKAVGVSPRVYRDQK
ncbi:AraC family two component transcriptional regulator [Bacillus oleivorans]|uniref:AraC family two component transcriptional regulator n=1 Tax=Bacillus oleivorans TaxID=1448271 RepID=A0A285CI58_9BACI|nr:helix-turn-helix domain-containing protein [Bacillus oleivorans]SNX67282.1 AraC family two component transcriptional regulator [Bacillus oleivorans]